MSHEEFKEQFCYTVNKKKHKRYQNQAMELIKICRYLSAVSEQSPHQDHRLQGVLRTCDMAIKESALGSKVRGPTEQKIKDAIRELLGYWEKYPPSEPFGTRMEVAEKADKKRSQPDRISLRNKTLKVVNFRILRSLPDSQPNSIIVKQALISAFELVDILWNFVLVNDDDDDKRLFVTQSPHFYLTDPTLENGAYQEPVVELTWPCPNEFHVLPNNEHRVYLELEDTRRRTFDLVWRTNGAFSFKDIFGNLESETTFGGSIPNPPLFRFCMNPPEFEPGEGIGDWRDAIFRLWNSPVIRVHIMRNDNR